MDMEKINKFKKMHNEYLDKLTEEGLNWYFYDLTLLGMASMIVEEMHDADMRDEFEKLIEKWYGVYIT